MNKKPKLVEHSNSKGNDNLLMATGLLTDFAFFQSLLKSKTLRVLTLLSLILGLGFVWFLFSMASSAT